MTSFALRANLPKRLEISYTVLSCYSAIHQVKPLLDNFVQVPFFERPDLAAELPTNSARSAAGFQKRACL
jgi:hypothetical protein